MCLSGRCSRSLALFRLRVAPVNRNFQFDAPVYDRLCSFCVNSSYGRFVEDEYHVCFDCPLYESLRCKLLLKLINSNFSFPHHWSCLLNNCPPAPELLAALLNVKAPAHVRQVALFLFECLALRCVYLTQCGITSKSISFWLRFVTKSERERLEALLCEANENSKKSRLDSFELSDSFAQLLSRHFNVHKPVPKYLGVLLALAPCPLY